MSKRRFSDVTTSIFRARKYRLLQRRGSCRALTTVASVPHSYTEDDVLTDVQIMATVATGPAIDDLIRNTMPIDALWQPDSVSQSAETTPSRSASIKSKLDISSALPSLAASPVLSPRGGVFFLRSDAESLGDNLQPKPHDRAHSAAPTSTSIDLTSPAVSPESATNAHPFARSPLAIAAPPLTSSPGNTINRHADIVSPPSTRPGRPTLARLNTSEMLRRQTSTAFEPATTRPAAGRRSPSALKLQLDTSVPRRSATLSSYPHGKKPNQRSPPHPTLTLLSPASSAQDSIITGTTMGESPARAVVGDIEASTDAHNDDVQRTRDNFSFENVEFQVSTILPNFLYLGPDVQTEEAVGQLKAMGVRRILNVACEIEDTGPLKIPNRFDRYLKLPMLDSVEAQGVQSSIEQACSFLDDARLRSEPVYVHCKAGKSRSVTIVIAYLIHALGWSLQRSYSHVSEKRTAICPNIGFVAELMRFEEKKLNLARSTGINIDSNEIPPAGASKSTPHLLAGAQQFQSGHPSPSRDTSPLVSAPAHDAHKRIDGDTSSSLVSSASRSSPNLPSLKFGSD